MEHMAGTTTSTSGSSTAIGSSNDSNTISSREQIEARAAVLGSLQSAGSAYDSQLQRRATDLHENAAAISTQELKLKQLTTDLAKETETWRKEADKGSDGLKQFGDLQNWAEVMERDLLVVEETLRLVENGHRADSASGGSTWK